METNDFVVKISGLIFKRDSRTIFDNINLSIPKGKVVAVMGPSGSGKTTLLRLIGGILRPHEGMIQVFEKNIHRLSKRKLYRLRRRMGMLYQSAALFTNENVFNNVAFPLRAHTKLNESMIRDCVLLKLQAVGLRGARDLMPAELSGGMARRVALARAIALDPDIIMYDEPFTGQDPIGKGVLVKLIKTLNQVLGLTTVIVSHDVEETLSIADYVYIIAEGKIIGEGTPDILRQSDSEQVKQFISGLPDGVVPFHYAAKNLEQDLMTEEMV